MYCKNCNKEIDENVSFCPHCGKAHQSPSKAAASLLMQDADEIIEAQVDNEETIEEMPQA